LTVRGPRRRPPVVCLLLLLGLAGPAAAQDVDPQARPASAAYIGRTIASVRLLIEDRPAGDPILDDLVQTRVGRPLLMTEVRQSIAHLFSLRRFQDVRVEARPSGEHVELLYHLVPLRAVSRVQFRGTLGLSEGLLRRTVTGRFGASPPVGRATEIARILEEQLYADHGYLRADVRAVLIDDPRDAASTELVFEVDAGPRARIGDVQLSGQPGEAGAFLRRIGAVSGAPYEPLRLSDELNRYVDDVRRAGRYEANASYRPVVSEDRTLVGLTVDVEAGPLVILRFEGDTLPADRLDELVPLRREASAHQDLLEDSEQRIRAYLAQQGYWRAAVSHRVDDDGDRRTIVFTVARGLQYRLADSVQVTGNRSVPYEELRPMVTRLQAGDVFLASHLDAAVAAIESLYLGRGFAQVAVDAAVNETNPTPAGVGQVRPAIVITEGPQTTVGDVTFLGNDAITDARLASLVTLAPGMPYFVPRVADDRELVLLEYLNEGYATADVQVAPVLSDDGTSASIVYRIVEGPQTIVDHILIIGNTRTDPDIIRRELLFRTGEPLGLADLIESRRRLAALGLFRRVQITELSHGGSNEHDVLVTVEEAPATTLSYGGGLEASRRLRRGEQGEALERLEFAPRGFFDVGRRNVGGKNRSVNLYTRVSLRPRDSARENDGEGFGFSDYRVVLTYLEPRPYGINGDLTITGAAEQGVRSAFNFARKGVTAELHRRLSPRVRTSGRYSFATTRIFDARLDEEDQALIDRRFPQVRLSTVAGAISRDTRDDVLEPTRGMFMGFEGSMAARALGGQVGFLKGYGQALWFTRVPGGRSLVVATRLAVGIADGFPRPAGQVNEDGEIEEVSIEDLPASERFFAGGDTTIRGFALDTVGAGNTISPQGFPRGGNAVLLMNGELRVPVTTSLGAALFLDGGNVYERITDFGLDELRGSYGFGVRYRSPLGPIRFDLGFKIAPRPNESSRAFHFSFGQAF
jgi:outer membrane protein insertion porin family